MSSNTGRSSRRTIVAGVIASLVILVGVITGTALYSP